MTISRHDSIKRFEQKQLVFAVLGLLFLVGASIIANSLHLQSVAEQNTRFISRMIQIEDFREVGLVLQEARLGNFKQIQFKSQRSGRSFSLPPMENSFNHDSIWNRVSIEEVTIPTYNPLLNEKSDFITFSYDRFRLVPYAFFAWLILILVSIPQTRFMKRKMEYQFEKDLILERGQIKAEVARQVRHNLRTPLAALMRVPSRLPDILKFDRDLLTSSINQIKAITAALDDSRTNDEDLKTISENIYDSILRSCREISLSSPNQVVFTSEIDDIIFSTSIPHIPHEFQALLGNIVNNSFDAIGGNQGTVNLLAKDLGAEILIIIEDSGFGIAPEIITHVFDSGFSSGKINGSGLGLYHAKLWVERWGGRIRAESSPNKNTRINIWLPIKERAGWYSPRIKLKADEKLVILDDQKAARDLWELKLREAGLLDRAFIISNKGELFALIESNQSLVEQAHFLFDYDIGDDKTGLDLLENLSVAGTRRYLVTGHFDQFDIGSRCLGIGTFLLPKSEITSIPIIFHQS